MSMGASWMLKAWGTDGMGHHHIEDKTHVGSRFKMKKRKYFDLVCN